MTLGNFGPFDSVGADCKHVLTVLAKENHANGFDTSSRSLIGIPHI